MREWKFTAGDIASAPWIGFRSKSRRATRSGTVVSKYSKPVTQNAPSRSSARALTWPPTLESHPSRCSMRRAAEMRHRMSFSSAIGSRSVMSEPLGVGLHLGGHRVPEQRRRVLPRELADVVGGEVADLVAQDGLGVGPG